MIKIIKKEGINYVVFKNKLGLAVSTEYKGEVFAEWTEFKKEKNEKEISEAVETLISYIQEKIETREYQDKIRKTL